MTVFTRYNAYMLHRKNSKENLRQCSQEKETYYIYSFPTILQKMENTKVFVFIIHDRFVSVPSESCILSTI